MVTIREIADRSGFSTATVSRVLNELEGVSDETRERVLAVAAELDYTPYAAARTLVTRRSSLIGAVVFTGDQPEFQHPFFQVVLDGVKTRLDASGYDLLLLTGSFRSGPENAAYIDRVRRHRVDGIVLMGASLQDAGIARLAKLRIPTVAIDLEVTGERVGFVTSDNVEGARIAVRHLHDTGRRRIATIAGILDTSPGERRLAGYERELEALHLPLREEYVRVGDFYAESGYQAMRELLALPNPPDGVFAASDLMAIGAIRAADEARVRVPEDVAIVGFDDIHYATFVSPPLTTIRQDKAALGEQAAAVLVEMIDDPAAEPPQLMLPVELIVRGSTGA